MDEIWKIGNKKEEKLLRKKVSEFDFSKFTQKQVNDLVARMRKIMHAANGIGLSANQIGLDMKVFVAEIPDARGGTKFYSVFNPTLEKVGDEKVVYEEGCLSIPGTWGDVERTEQIVVNAFDKRGKPVKFKAWGLLARVFQHEMDHLDGKVFTDRTKKVHKAETNS